MKIVFVCVNLSFEKMELYTKYLSGIGGIEELEMWIISANGNGSVNDCDFNCNKVVLIKTGETDFLAEYCTTVISELLESSDSDLFVFPDTFLATSVAQRIAVAMDLPIISDVETVDVGRGRFVVSKLAYAAKIRAKITLDVVPAVITLQSPMRCSKKNKKEREFSEYFPTTVFVQPSWLQEYEFVPSVETGSLEEAESVLVIGRGVLKRGNAEKCCRLADKFACGVGGTRPVIMNEWLPAEALIGISGHKLTAKRCVVFGASGAAAFVSGIRNCERVIGINSVAESALFDCCDIGIVGDCAEIMDALIDIK